MSQDDGTPMEDETLGFADYKELGNGSYKRKDYREAIDHYTMALQVSDLSTVHAEGLSVSAPSGPRICAAHSALSPLVARGGSSRRAS